MSWVKICDGFEDHPKVEPLSDAAHRLWVRAACWCRKNDDHTAGFVPRAMLRTIAKNTLPQAKLEKLAQELVEARGGGIFEHGLWEPCEDGWLFHDWAVYQPKQKEPSTPEERSEAARRAGQASAAARRAINGTAQPSRASRTPPNGTESVRGAFDRTEPERAPERLEPPDPDPVPEKNQAIVELGLDAQRVFEFWKQDTGKPKAIADSKRLSRIKARLREGRTADQLITAIRNRRNDPFLMGQNDTGHVYDGIETLLRDAGQVERLLDLAAPMKAPAKPSNARFEQQVAAEEAAERRVLLEKARDGRYGVQFATRARAGDRSDAFVAELKAAPLVPVNQLGAVLEHLRQAAS